MIKKILRVTSIIIAIFVFILIWMHIDVTLGRKDRSAKIMRKNSAYYIIVISQLVCRGNPFIRQLFADIREAKRSHLHLLFHFVG